MDTEGKLCVFVPPTQSTTSVDFEEKAKKQTRVLVSVDDGLRKEGPKSDWYCGLYFETGVKNKRLCYTKFEPEKSFLYYSFVDLQWCIETNFPENRVVLKSQPTREKNPPVSFIGHVKTINGYKKVNLLTELLPCKG